MTAISRVLVVKLADIGDAVLALPTIQAIRANIGSLSRLDVLTTPTGANVFRMSPSVNDVLQLAKDDLRPRFGLNQVRAAFDTARLATTLRNKRYSAVILLHHLTAPSAGLKYRALAAVTRAPVVAGLDNGRGSFLTHRAIDYGFGARTEWEYGLEVVRALGFDAEPSRPEMEVPADARQTLRQKLDNLEVSKPYVLLHHEVGSFSPARAWPSHNFVETAELLVESGDLMAVFVGASTDASIREASRTSSNMVDLTGRTTFPELCALVEQANLVIGGDSAVVHLAAAFDRPLLAIYGPSNVAAWKPYGADHLAIDAAADHQARSVALHSALPCAPCIYRGFELGRPGGCPLRTCMHSIRPEQVAKVARLMSDQARTGCATMYRHC